jgi:hypothetical protein
MLPPLTEMCTIVPTPREADSDSPPAPKSSRTLRGTNVHIPNELRICRSGLLPLLLTDRSSSANLGLNATLGSLLVYLHDRS